MKDIFKILDEMRSFKAKLFMHDYNEWIQFDPEQMRDYAKEYVDDAIRACANMIDDYIIDNGYKRNIPGQIPWNKEKL